MERRYRSKKVSAMQQSAVIEQRSSIPANCPKFKVRTNFDESSAAMPLEEVYPSLFLFSALTSCRVVLTFWSSILSSTQYHAWSLPRVIVDLGFFSSSVFTSAVFRNTHVDRFSFHLFFRGEGSKESGNAEEKRKVPPTRRKTS